MQFNDNFIDEEFHQELFAPQSVVNASGQQLNESSQMFSAINGQPKAGPKSMSQSNRVLDQSGADLSMMQS
jgi:hypothetical protein